MVVAQRRMRIGERCRRRARSLQRGGKVTSKESPTQCSRYNREGVAAGYVKVWREMVMESWADGRRAMSSSSVGAPAYTAAGEESRGNRRLDYKSGPASEIDARMQSGMAGYVALDCHNVAISVHARSST